MPRNLAIQAYFRHNDMNYRIQIFEDREVWVERQTPHAINGNLPMGDVADEVMYGSETWLLDAIAPLLDRYEKEYAAEGEGGN